MNLNDLLRYQGLNPERVISLRHRPSEPELNKVLPWLAADRPELFNAYQQTQTEKLERAMQALVGDGHVASFIGNEPGKALFVGLYSIAGTRPLTYDQYWNIPENIDLKNLGMKGFSGDDRSSILWFDLVPGDFYSHWRGKLVVEWPPPERSWWRRAHRNEMPVVAVLEESALTKRMPGWDEIELGWEQLAVLPASWKSAIAQWRGVYYIFDVSDGKGYVGSACGEENILGRWLSYASTGHGGNVLLRGRDFRNFRFSILQRVSPDMEADDVIRCEISWKQRLHTREPYGLNDN